MADEREVLVEVKNLEVTYGSGRKAYKAVKNANFTIYKGETFGLVGESGSGKTTIGRAIMRILPTSGGEVFYKGQKINGKISHALDKQVIKEIQMIFQDPQSSLNERAKVSYIVGEGLMNVRPDLSAAERDEKLANAIAAYTGYTVKSTPGSVGGYKDWCIQTLQIPSFTVEVGSDDFLHPFPYSQFRTIYEQNADLPRRLLNTVVSMRQS